MPSPPAALLAVGAPRRTAVKRNGSAPYTGVPRVRVAVDDGVADDDFLTARVRLLEGFVGRSEIADTAQLALQWLGESLGIRQSICLIRPDGEPSLFVVGAYGLGSSVTSYAVSLEDWSNPLVPAFNQRKVLFFPAPHSAADRKRRPSTPLEDAAFHAVPLGVSGVSDDAFGLLLVGGAAAIGPDVHWFTSVLSQKLEQLLRQNVLAEGDRKQGRERTLLYNIINAVSDPILLTDTEGPALIANARALTALHRVGGGKAKGGAARPPANMLLRRRALEQGDRGNRRDPARAAARQPGGQVGPGLRAVGTVTEDRGKAAASRVDSAQRHRPAAPARSKRTTADASRRCRPAPATGST
jgi:hypothetical protein